jgi:hypothetical protein
VTSTDGDRGPDPIDPDYAALFRPEDLAPAPGPSADPATSVDAEEDIEAEAAPSPEPEPAIATEEPAAAAAEPEPAIAPADPLVDTGRLFRSQGVEGHAETVLALSSDRTGKLRTLDRRGDEGPAAAPLPPLSAPVAVDVLEPVSEDPAHGTDEPATKGRRSRRERTAATERTRGLPHTGSITGGAVALIVIGVTVLVGFLNALLGGGTLGWPTGLALLVSSVYCALTVRRDSDFYAMVIPPVAFLIAALTAGQAFVGSLQGSIISRASIVFFALGSNWPWILGSTLIAVVIVLVRRRRG